MTLTTNAPVTINPNGMLQVWGTWNNSSVTTLNGTLNLGGSSTTNNTGTVKGNGGSVTGSKVFTNGASGTVSPGASPGCLTFNPGLVNNGTINIEINGLYSCSNFDQIYIPNTLTNNGPINIQFGFTPAVNDVFPIVCVMGSGWGCHFLNCD